MTKGPSTFSGVDSGSHTTLRASTEIPEGVGRGKFFRRQGLTRFGQRATIATMRYRIPLILVATVPFLACGGPQSATGSADAAPAAPAADASTFSAHGMTVSRPDGWSFIPPDPTVGPDTVVVLQGPHSESPLAAAVEISRRSLSARDQRRKPAHVLTQLVTEMVQLFDGFEMVGQPEDITLAGKDAATVRLKFTETLPEGGTVERSGRFYGVIEGANIWVIRCLGAVDGSDDAAIEQVIASINIAS